MRGTDDFFKKTIIVSMKSCRTGYFSSGWDQSKAHTWAGYGTAAFNLEEIKAEREYGTEKRKLDMQAEELKVKTEDSRRK